MFTEIFQWLNRLIIGLMERFNSQLGFNQIWVCDEKSRAERHTEQINLVNYCLRLASDAGPNVMGSSWFRNYSSEITPRVVERELHQ